MLTTEDFGSSMCSHEVSRCALRGEFIIVCSKESFPQCIIFFTSGLTLWRAVTVVWASYRHVIVVERRRQVF